MMDKKKVQIMYALTLSSTILLAFLLAMRVFSFLVVHACYSLSFFLSQGTPPSFDSIRLYIYIYVYFLFYGQSRNSMRHNSLQVSCTACSVFSIHCSAVNSMAFRVLMLFLHKHTRLYRCH